MPAARKPTAKESPKLILDTLTAAAANALAGLTVPDIAARTGIHEGDVLKHLGALTETRQVTRRENPADRSRGLWSLAPAKKPAPAA